MLSKAWDMSAATAGDARFTRGRAGARQWCRQGECTTSTVASADAAAASATLFHIYIYIYI